MCPLKVCNAVPLKLSNSFISARISILTETVPISQREIPILEETHASFVVVLLNSPSHPQLAQFLPYPPLYWVFLFSKACIFTQRTQDCLCQLTGEGDGGQQKKRGPLPMLYSLLNVRKKNGECAWAAGWNENGLSVRAELESRPVHLQAQASNPEHYF